ncbi:hypothetical protein CRM22_009770 [Opisthorchis felineus]|uniref:Uncharacterized protein n=1 Tax=Opisthorchis felineus TaxID=147828 RepID=A0A4S2LCP2_OPIFE|nr:hypothetical protein CRM22_009770 [Opisthorchis felineus]TGZ58068.1 hypothetical protein CRM22_009770 [Opisthorchis felineus]
MKTTCLNPNKATSSLGRTRKRSNEVTSSLHQTTRTGARRRNFSSSNTSRLSPFPEEEQIDGSTKNHSGRSTGDSLAQFRPYSPPATSVMLRAPHLLSHCNCSHRPSMPPGPPTSPVPSPPPASLAQLPHSTSVQSSSAPSLTADLPPDILCEDSTEYTANSMSKHAVPDIPGVFRNRLRRRRNAICATSALGQGLKEFFTSYVVSHLTESMTSSLSLDANPPASVPSSAHSVFLPPNSTNGATPTPVDPLPSEMELSSID